LRFPQFDRQFFDTLILAVFAVGALLAGLRLWQDFTRPLPADDDDDDSPAGA
jgi:hypothetical protein